MMSKAISGLIAGAVVSIAFLVLHIPVDLVFLIFQLLFAFSYWMDDSTYVTLLQGYIAWLLLVIFSYVVSYTVTKRVKRRKKK